MILDTGFGFRASGSEEGLEIGLPWSGGAAPSVLSSLEAFPVIVPSVAATCSSKVSSFRFKFSR